mgnify:CR=1 FL=1
MWPFYNFLKGKCFPLTLGCPLDYIAYTHESLYPKHPMSAHYTYNLNFINKVNQNMHFNIKERYKYCQLTTNKRVDPHLYKSITLSFLL